MNVEELQRCNMALLEQLAPLGVTSEDDPSDLLAVIAKAFTLVAPFFAMYTAYCAKYDGAVAGFFAFIFGARRPSGIVFFYLLRSTLNGQYFIFFVCEDGPRALCFLPRIRDVPPAPPRARRAAFEATNEGRIPTAASE